MNEQEPHNLEAERAVLGSILLDSKEAVSKVAPMLTVGDFFDEKNGRTYGGMLAIFQRSGVVDLLTLNEELNGGKPETVDAAYLSSLTDGIPDIGNVEHYARIVKEKARLRRLVRAGERIVREALSQEKTADEIATEAEKEIGRAATSSTPRIPETWLSPAGVLRGSPLPKARFKSTITALNLASRGGHPTGALTVVQGPPDGGKTGLALQEALEIAVSFEVVTVIYTPDQGREWTAIRIGALLGLDAQKLEGRDEAEIAKLDELLRERKIFLPDDSDERQTVEAVIATAERISPELTHILVLDSLQEARANSRTEEGGERDRTVANVRACQKATKSPRVSWLVLATSQTTKASAARDPKNRPPEVLAGAESAKIGFAAQLVIHLDGDPAQGPGFGRGRVVKNKLGGPKPSFGLRLDPATTRLHEIDSAEADRQRGELAERGREKTLSKLADQILAFLIQHGPLNVSALQERIAARRADILDALSGLEAQGAAAWRPGPRNSHVWEAVRRG